MGAGIHEKAGFMAYHAFESSGSALADSCGIPVGGKVSHPKKLDNFRLAARRCRRERPVAALAVTLQGLRNRLLYPIPSSGGHGSQVPEKALTPTEAQKLLARVQGVVNWVDREI